MGQPLKIKIIVNLFQYKHILITFVLMDCVWEHAVTYKT